MIDETRAQVGITTFMYESRLKGVSKATAVSAYLNGLSAAGDEVDLKSRVN